MDVEGDARPSLHLCIRSNDWNLLIRGTLFPTPVVERRGLVLITTFVDTEAGPYDSSLRIIKVLSGAAPFLPTKPFGLHQNKSLMDNVLRELCSSNTVF